MTRRVVFSWIVGASVFLDGALAAAEVEVETFTYAERGSGDSKVELALDLARDPSGDHLLRPVVVCIHGGGWAGGNRGAYGGLIQKLAEQGYVAASVSYRLVPTASWPAQFDDVADAVKWLRANASKYGMDPERFAALGHSAGGHLSLLLGLTPDGEKHESSRVQAVVNYFGPVDMRERWSVDDKETEEKVEQLILGLAGGPRDAHLDQLTAASPITYVGRDDAPVITFHGTRDQIVPVTEARALDAALRAAKVPHQLEIIEGAGHGWGGDETKRSTKQTMSFLDSYLRVSDLPLVAHEDFSAGASRWKTTDATAWKVNRDGARHWYSLVKRVSDYKPKVRSPHNIALLDGVKVSDFVLDLRFQSTTKPYGHQSLCLFFGYQDPTHFYYVHFGRKRDAHAHSVFLVNDKPRVSIVSDENRTEGTDWSLGWHRARIRRDASEGAIEVYLDDMTKPIMTTVDKTFVEGQVGVGSFDDKGNFDAIRLFGRVVE